jgi:aspartate/methionine/tyrosine aminotransferase
MTTTASRLAALPRSATVDLADAATTLRTAGVDVIDLSAGRAAEPTPGYVVDAAVAALRAGHTHQTLAIGLSEYRVACAGKLRREQGIDADPDREILATLGVKQGLTLALLATIDPGDEVIVQDPCFVSYQPLIQIAGGVPVDVPLRRDAGFKWDRAELEARITPRTRALLVNSPQNPTGAVLTDQDIEWIGRVAAAHDLLLLSDEVYDRVTWGGRPHRSPAAHPGLRERTITLMGLSKTFSMGGWRIGFVHAPARLAHAMAALQAHLVTCASSFVQAGAAAAFGSAPRPEVVELWREWERRCEFVAGALNAVPGVTCGTPEGGYYAWPDISGTGWDDEALASALLETARVVVVPGSAFGPSGRGFLRVTCVRSWPEIREAVQRIARVIESGPR